MNFNGVTTQSMTRRKVGRKEIISNAMYLLRQKRNLGERGLGNFDFGIFDVANFDFGNLRDCRYN